MGFNAFNAFNNHWDREAILFLLLSLSNEIIRFNKQLNEIGLLAT